MSAHFVDAGAWVPLAVLLASLAGSGHCVAMCGGLMVSVTRDRGSWTRYQFGRLVGYLALGALAGSLGAAIFSGTAAQTGWIGMLSWAAAIAIAASLVITGVRVLRGASVHGSILPARALAWLFRKGAGGAGSMGLLSAFLPCGWLHTFVLGAVATRSPAAGAMFLLTFWIGTLPAMGLAPWLFERVFRPAGRRSPKFAGAILIVAGFISLGIKVKPWPTDPPASNGHVVRRCH